MLIRYIVDLLLLVLYYIKIKMLLVRERLLLASSIIYF